MGDCVKDLGEIWCYASVGLGSFSCIYLAISIYMIVKHLEMFKTGWSSLMIVLYVQTLEALVMALHYLLIGFEFDMLFVLQEILLMVLVTVIFYFFTSEIGKIIERQSFSKKISIPLVIFNVVYTIIIIVASIVFLVKDEQFFTCNIWIWLFSSISGISMSLVLFSLGIYMNKEIMKMSIYSSSQVSKPRLKQLWFFNIVMVISFTIMLIDSIIKDTEMTTCIDYSSNTVVSIFLFVIIRLATHYTAMTFVIYIFWPSKVKVKCI
ncbi:hypothetical protein SteCoe_4257 [Stentor coeruleus]|uniref:THH1/TOM1/TOM3 domain-containing protein n=1 Tax=Stentor coeruleus TaxID=5963 RepID=A0A1R2CVA8_9CILI|nr:hypothetical protein SteCoe_4257 [Stentor coeruleus]